MAMDGHDLEVLVSHTATLGWEKSGLATDAQEDVELATGFTPATFRLHSSDLPASLRRPSNITPAPLRRPFGITPTTFRHHSGDPLVSLRRLPVSLHRPSGITPATFRRCHFFLNYFCAKVGDVLEVDFYTQKKVWVGQFVRVKVLFDTLTPLIPGRLGHVQAHCIMPPLVRSPKSTFGPKIRADSSAYRRFFASTAQPGSQGGSGMALPIHSAPTPVRPLSSARSPSNSPSVVSVPPRTPVFFSSKDKSVLLHVDSGRPMVPRTSASGVPVSRGLAAGPTSASRGRHMVYSRTDLLAVATGPCVTTGPSSSRSCSQAQLEVVTNDTVFYTNLDFFFGQREAWAKEAGLSSRPSQFSHISLGRTCTLASPTAHSVSIQELVDEHLGYSDSVSTSTVVKSPASSSREVVVHTSMTTSSKRKLVCTDDADDLRSVKRFTGAFHLRSMSSPVDSEDSLPLAMWRGLSAHHMHRTVRRGGEGSRARRQADFVVGSRASEEAVILGAFRCTGVRSFTSCS
ncbi:hypothetical protein CJ030_MR2G012401 [Morella rubra]|uniref:Uncharacterized protein n=1 Tax=Morella rubra TaxID=262757 RepID=A0A6A1WDS2_9ROSI|nr:hypothetical protein CJ030_MR2G012401 [Morella rubra]